MTTFLSNPIRLPPRTRRCGLRVGKTCLLNRFTRESYSDTSQPTLGVEFISKILDTPKGRRLELQLWDTAGQEAFRAVTRGYYRNATVAYFIFDLANGKSFESLPGWLADVQEAATGGITAVLIGNKSDLESREVEYAKATEFAKDHKMKYFECSAKLGTNVVQAFVSVLPELDQMAGEGKLAASRPTESIVYDQAPQERSCC
jgi:small GTP-binding protein